MSKRVTNQPSRIVLDASAEDLDRRLLEAMMRLERVRTKAMNAVESMLASR